MAVGDLKIDARRNKILEILNRDGQVRVTQLSEELGATTVTIRSDLDALEQDGYLERIQGGAVQTVRNYYNLEFLRRKQENSEAKKSIASAAADIIRDGDTILINSGTTTYYTAIELKKRKNLNIVTNSLMVASELGAYPTFRVILLGGEINTQYSFTYGSDAQGQLRQYKAEYAILSIDGVCFENGLTTYHAEEAVINRIMMERAKKTVIVADSRKLGREGFLHVSDLSNMDILVTDHEADLQFLSRLQEKKVEVFYGKDE